MESIYNYLGINEKLFLGGTLQTQYYSVGGSAYNGYDLRSKQLRGYVGVSEMWPSEQVPANGAYHNLSGDQAVGYYRKEMEGLLKKGYTPCVITFSSNILATTRENRVPKWLLPYILPGTMASTATMSPTELRNLVDALREPRYRGSPTFAEYQDKQNQERFDSLRIVASALLLQQLEQGTYQNFPQQSILYYHPSKDSFGVHVTPEDPEHSIPVLYVASSFAAVWVWAMLESKESKENNGIHTNIGRTLERVYEHPIIDVSNIFRCIAASIDDRNQFVQTAVDFHMKLQKINPAGKNFNQDQGPIPFWRIPVLRPDNAGIGLSTVYLNGKSTRNGGPKLYIETTGRIQRWTLNLGSFLDNIQRNASEGLIVGHPPYIGPEYLFIKGVFGDVLKGRSSDGGSKLILLDDGVRTYVLEAAEEILGRFPDRPEVLVNPFPTTAEKYN